MIGPGIDGHFDGVIDEDTLHIAAATLNDHLADRGRHARR